MLLDKINQSGAQIIFVGFGCPRQEKWIFQNLDKLSHIKLAMAVGGTLDFLSGNRKRATYFMRKLGLEWLWRLIQEPSRAKRIWNATAVFLWTVIKWRMRMKAKLNVTLEPAVIQKGKKIAKDRNKKVRQLRRSLANASRRA